MFWQSDPLLTISSRLRPYVALPNQATTSECPKSDANAWQLVRFHGQPFDRAHFRTSSWPVIAAASHISASNRHLFACAHCSISRWPPIVISAQVFLSSGQLLACAHFITSRRPNCAATPHISAASHGHPFAHTH